jgi:hypothetical protein
VPESGSGAPGGLRYDQVLPGTRGEVRRAARRFGPPSHLPIPKATYTNVYGQPRASHLESGRWTMRGGSSERRGRVPRQAAVGRQGRQPSAGGGRRRPPIDEATVENGRHAAPACCGLPRLPPRANAVPDPGRRPTASGRRGLARSALPLRNRSDSSPGLARGAADSVPERADPPGSSASANAGLRDSPAGFSRSPGGRASRGGQYGLMRIRADYVN